MSWESWARRECDAIAETGRWRRVCDLDGRGPVVTTSDGRDVISFASNDYLGLTTNPAVIAGARTALDRWGAGSGSARLIVGSRPVHSALENAIAEWKHTPRATLFPTGFAANLGVLQTFGGRDVLICSDELNHASIIDGCRLAHARVAVYPHRDMNALARLLAGNDRTIVVTDTVFSMDGDIAPLDDIIELCARHGSLVILDEAHAVLGPWPDLEGVDAIRVGTLSKFLGAAGGFAAGRAEFIDLIINRARAGIFTTASTPADAGAALAALRVLQSSEGESLKSRLRENIKLLHPRARSPIVPVIIGDERAAVEASAQLLERGFLVPAIRPPSVPAGTARLRITLTAAHRPADVLELRSALASVVKAPSRINLFAAGPPPENNTAPSDVVVIAGTDTEVGKTWTTAQLIGELTRGGAPVAVRKPVQSFDPADGWTDAEILAAAAHEEPEAVCPKHRWYEIPMAPPMAARVLGRPPIRLQSLLEELAIPDGGITLVEGVGGALSPLAEDGDTAALAAALGARAVVLVAPSGLGAINAVRLAAAAFTPIRPIVFLNRFDLDNDLHVLNRDWLTNVDEFTVCESIARVHDALTARLDTARRRVLEVQ